MNRSKVGGAVLVAAFALVLGSSVLAAEAPAAGPHADIPAQLHALPGVGIFATAFEDHGVVALLESDLVYTIFAPTDGGLERAGLTFATADDVLAWVIPGTFTVEDLMEMVGDTGEVLELETVAGTQMTLQLGQANEMVINEIAVVAVPGQLGASTIVHVIELEGALEGVGGSDEGDGEGGGDDPAAPGS